jgi:hypothetical protein
MWILLKASPGSILIVWHELSLIILKPIFPPLPPTTSISPKKWATAKHLPIPYSLYYFPEYLIILVLNKLKSFAYKAEFFPGKSSALP